MGKREVLLEQRGRLLEQAETILTVAQRAGRGLSDEEKARHDGLVAQAKSLNDLLLANAQAEAQAAVTIPRSQAASVQTPESVAAAGVTVPHGPSDAWNGAAGSGTTPDDRRFGGISFASVFASQGRESFASGGIVVPERLFAPWPYLTPVSIALSLGARVLAVRDNTLIPQVSSRPVASVVGEDQEIPPTSTGLQGHKVWFRKVASLQIAENDVMRSADVNFSALLLEEQIRAHGLKVDHLAFEGTGTEHAPRGLRAHPGILGAAVAANGGELEDLDDLISALSALEAENARPTGWAMHPTVWGGLMRLRDQTDSLRPLLGEQFGASATAGISRRLLGLPVALSSQLATDEVEGSSGAVCSSIYCGQWDQLIIARDASQETYIDIDAGERFSRDQVQIRVLTRFDIAMPNPRAFFRLRGVLASS